MLTLKLDLLQTLSLAAVLFLIGLELRKRIGWLDRLNIPAAVVGGLLFALLVLAGRDRFLSVQLDTAAQPVLSVAFFSTIGMGASLGLLRAGGIQVVVFLLFATLFCFVQNFLGIAIARGFGRFMAVPGIEGRWNARGRSGAARRPAGAKPADGCGGMPPGGIGERMPLVRRMRRHGRGGRRHGKEACGQRAVVAVIVVADVGGTRVCIRVRVRVAVTLAVRGMRRTRPLRARPQPPRGGHQRQREHRPEGDDVREAGAGVVHGASVRRRPRARLDQDQPRSVDLRARDLQRTRITRCAPRESDAPARGGLRRARTQSRQRVPPASARRTCRGIRIALPGVSTPPRPPPAGMRANREARVSR